jgi:hypothetical protein
MCFDIADNCLSIVLLLVFAGIIGYLICKAVRAQRRANVVRHGERRVIEGEKEAIKDQNERLKTAFERIADATDPLESFIDAITQRDGRKRRRE